MVDGSLEVGEHETLLWGTTPVTLRAPTPIGRVNELYASIDVLLAPSIWPESYGLVVREALHYRTWVVVSNRGALAQDVVE
ncbi:glycosyltransferase, partial [Acinetobacter baumannii]